MQARISRVLSSTNEVLITGARAVMADGVNVLEFTIIANLNTGMVTANERFVYIQGVDIGQVNDGLLGEVMAMELAHALMLLRECGRFPNLSDIALTRRIDFSAGTLQIPAIRWTYEGLPESTPPVKTVSEILKAHNDEQRSE